MSFIQTVEADVTALWGKIEGAVEVAAEGLWSLAKNFYTETTATLAPVLQAELTKFLSGEVDLTQSLEDLESAFMDYLRTAQNPIVADVEAIGSKLVQALIALVVHTL